MTDIEPQPERRFDLKGVFFFVLALAAIWFVGTVLTPILPEEYVVMIIYAILYVFLGFDPTKWLRGK